MVGPIYEPRECNLEFVLVREPSPKKFQLLDVIKSSFRSVDAQGIVSDKIVPSWSTVSLDMNFNLWGHGWFCGCTWEPSFEKVLNLLKQGYHIHVSTGPFDLVENDNECLMICYRDDAIRLVTHCH